MISIKYVSQVDLDNFPPETFGYDYKCLLLR